MGVYYAHVVYTDPYSEYNPLDSLGLSQLHQITSI